MRRVLLTAFEPFDGSGLNSSLEACRLFLEGGSQDGRIRFQVLPVEYGADTRIVDALLREWPADVVLHTGQAGKAERVRVERLARNQRYAAGPGSASRPILEDGPVELASTIAVEPVTDAIREAGVAVEVSNDAGIYLCNHVLYHSLLRAHGQVGFLHIPALPGQRRAGGPSMALEDTARAIAAALRQLACE